MFINHSVYNPLYTNNDKFICLITGGRGSGKSTAISTFIERLTFEIGQASGKKVSHQILYSRYTMVAAEISIIPEFMEKIEMDGTTKYFTSTKKDVINLMTDSKIMFRGIRSSSGNQTARLKSIKGLSVFVCDEGEEWVSEKEFETIMFSIRQLGIRNLIIIIMNPTDSNHFIYQKYIKDTHKLVEYDGVPVQISTHPNVLHIHTSYLDNIQYLSEQFIREAEEMKRTNPERYAHIFMGRWADVREGAVFKNWGVVDEFPSQCKHVARGLDFGYTCFSGDTMIMTDKGEIPIRDINPGDMVLTRRGYRRVKNKMYNGRKQVLKREIEVGDQIHTIKATLEHNFNVNGKWKQYGQLEKGDNLFTLSSSTVKPISDTLKENIQIISTTKRSEMEYHPTLSYIKTFGNSIMDHYPKGWLFTIKMETPLTMRLIIWWRSLQENMHNFIGCLKNTIKNIQNIERDFSSLRKIGRNVERKLTKRWQTLSECANVVVRSLLQPIPTRYVAPMLVTTDGNISAPTIMYQWSVNGVERSLWEINSSSPKHVAMSAPISYHGIRAITDLGEEECDVYDLEVEGIHEYFANGILVHNCDPSACVKCGVWNNCLYIDEQFYAPGMLSSDLIRELKKEKGMVYADSADPRLIDEIANAGIVIYPVSKGGGSIIAGIDKIQTFDHVFYTRRSINLQDEYRNYVWAKDKDGNYINEPEDHDNHCFTGDTLITTDKGERRMDRIRVGDMVMTSEGLREVENVFDNGERQIWVTRIRFGENEVILKATPDHKIKTTQGWKEIRELAQGDELYHNGQVKMITNLKVLDRRWAFVYDLQVQDMHEYYANGLLVHNCMDATRYYVLGHILGKVIKRSDVNKSDLGIY